MRSYLTHLECTVCGAEHDADAPQNVCTHCGRVLYPRYDLEGAARAVSPVELASRPSTMWRYFEVMPVRSPDNVISLGEGGRRCFTPSGLGRRWAALGCTSRTRG